MFCEDLEEVLVAGDASAKESGEEIVLLNLFLHRMSVDGGFHARVILAILGHESDRSLLLDLFKEVSGEAYAPLPLDKWLKSEYESAVQSADPTRKIALAALLRSQISGTNMAAEIVSAYKSPYPESWWQFQSRRLTVEEIENPDLYFGVGRRPFWYSFPLDEYAAVLGGAETLPPEIIYDIIICVAGAWFSTLTREEKIIWLNMPRTTPDEWAQFASPLLTLENPGPALSPAQQRSKIFWSIRLVNSCITREPEGMRPRAEPNRIFRRSVSQKKLKPEIKKPNIVVPASAHFSFDKNCDMLGVEMRIAPYGKNYTVNCDKMAELVDKNTISVAAIAGTTEYGMIDDVERMGKIALENDLFFHVDAAFGGMVIPFLPNPLPFDFEVPGVSSISLDPHKMGMSTIPCGCLLLREPEQFGTLNVDTPYLTVKKECTLAGTRPGADVAGAYAVIKFLGREGFRAVVAGCMENTRRLVEGMEAFGYTRAVDPVMNVATFEEGPVPKGWIVSHTRAGHLRFVVMPHVTRDVIENFLADVATIN